MFLADHYYLTMVFAEKHGWLHQIENTMPLVMRQQILYLRVSWVAEIFERFKKEVTPKVRAAV